MSKKTKSIVITLSIASLVAVFYLSEYMESEGIVDDFRFVWYWVGIYWVGAIAFVLGLNQGGGNKDTIETKLVNAYLGYIMLLLISGICIGVRSC